MRTPSSNRGSRGRGYRCPTADEGLSTWRRHTYGTYKFHQPRSTLRTGRALIISYLIGLRTGAYAEVFIEDIADRVDTSRPQITSDGLSAYPEAVDKIFGADVDYAQLVKTYGRDPDEPEHRYSPAKCISVEMGRVQGNPDRKNISTSYIERSNLTVRMANRRFTRLTNAFSKKWQNHVHALALQFFWYNFGRKHITLKGKTPAMVAGLTDRAWTVADLVRLLEDEERKLMKGGRINREDRS